MSDSSESNAFIAKPNPSSVANGSQNDETSKQELPLPPLESPPQPTVKHVSEIIGDTGHWQRCICVFFGVLGFFKPFHSLGISFYAPAKYDYWCAGTNRTDISEILTNTTDRCSCTSWEYDNTFFDRTIISEWDLVCDRSWLPSVSQSVYQISSLGASLVVAPLSDKFGRRHFIRLGLTGEILAGLVMYFSQSYTVFLVGRVFMSVATYSRAMSGAVVMSEVLGTRSRAFWIQCAGMGWVFGYMALPWVAYVARDFRIILLTVVCAEAVLWGLLYWAPESPRWLLTVGKYEEAEALIRWVVKFNRMSTDRLTERIKELQHTVREEVNKSFGEGKQDGNYGLFRGLREIFGPKARHLRSTIFILYFTWAVHSFVYYGVALNAGQFTLGDKTDKTSLAFFWGFFFQGAIEGPSVILTGIALHHFGRKTLTSAILTATGVSMLIAIFLQGDGPTMSYGRMACALAGKFFITSSWDVIALMTFELFPTVLRQTASGSCSAFARIGSTLAPFVKELSETSGLWMALLVFAVIAFLDAGLIQLVRESRGEEMPNTVGEAEKLELREGQSGVGEVRSFLLN